MSLWGGQESCIFRHRDTWYLKGTLGVYLKNVSLEVQSIEIVIILKRNWIGMGEQYVCVYNNCKSHGSENFLELIKKNEGGKLESLRIWNVCAFKLVFNLKMEIIVRLQNNKKEEENRKLASQKWKCLLFCSFFFRSIFIIFFILFYKKKVLFLPLSSSFHIFSFFFYF